TREISEFLNEFSEHGVPPLQGFDLAPIPEVAKTNIIWASGPKAFQDYLVGKFFSPTEQARIEVVKELVRTEAEHINHLTTMIEKIDRPSTWYASLSQRKEERLEENHRLLTELHSSGNARKSSYKVLASPNLSNTGNHGTFRPEYSSCLAAELSIVGDLPGLAL
ncbi:jg458, partial [Pararge aegeria aegeria]